MATTNRPLSAKAGEMLATLKTRDLDYTHVDLALTEPLNVPLP